MAKSSEEISKYNTSGGKPDSNLANDSLHLNGIPGDEFATKKYVQNYHGAKEELLKEYIDNQDDLKLQQAKTYTDVVVANQDFSNFAEVKDVEALRRNLSEDLAIGLNNQKNYTDEKVSALARDVNSNFDDVGQAITRLNSTTQELFTSVSNGKRNVAAAITDKGVSTASDASFDTMATNIRKIPTSGGETDPYYVNTGDGTAESNDIMLGKTAYVKGEKVYGSHVDIDTSDATANSSDILLGKTAYANGSKIYGTFINDDSKQYPTYGTDTSGATATPGDIALGKTAYANGSLLIGTLQTGALNPNVTEIYKAAEEEYIFNSNNIGNSNPPDGQPKTLYRRKIQLSHNADYAVILGASVTNPTVNDYYIESFPVGENGIYYMASSGATSETIEYKKYRYSRQELGIPDDEEIFDVILGSPGLDGNSQRCFLVILTSAGMRFYTYHLKENGIIGKEYNSQSGIIYNLLVVDDDFKGNKSVYASATLYNVFYSISSGTTYLRGYSGKKAELIFSVVNNNISYQLLTDDWYAIGGDVYYNSYGYEPYFTRDGKYILFNSAADSGTEYGYRGLFKLNSNGAIVGGSYQHRSQEYDISQIMLFNQNIGVDFQNIQENNTKKIKINVFELRDEIHQSGYDKYNIVRDITKTLYTNSIPNTSRIVGSPIISPDNKKIFAFLMDNTTGTYQYTYNVVSFNVDDILQATAGDTISFTESFLSSPAYTFGAYTKLASNFNCTNIKLYSSNPHVTKTPFMQGSHVETNDEQILGVKYKGMYFHKIQDQVLTAGQPDVRSGKTFIGWMGYPEVGTMQTESEE